MLAVGSLLAWTSLLPGAAELDVSWYTGGYQLEQTPVFQTKGIKKVGTVELVLELTPAGVVKQVKVANGAADLCAVAAQSAKSWRFRKVPNLPASLRVYVYFSATDGKHAPAPPPPPLGQFLGSVEIRGVSNDVRERLKKIPELRPGSMLTEDSIRKARRSLVEIDPKLVLSMTLDSDGKPVIRIAPRR